MRVAVRCRLPGTFRRDGVSVLPALVGPRKHSLGRAFRLPRVVIRLRVPDVGFPARDWLRRRPVSIVTPWEGKVRLAVLQPWFRVASGGRVFRELSTEALRRFAPGALAGPVPALRELARRIVNERAALAPLEFGVLAFTGPSQEPLTSADRELFWRAFQAPIFEQCRGPQGELLAYECDAHEGLHVVRESAVAQMRDWVRVESSCPCGARTPRAVPARARAAAG